MIQIICLNAGNYLGRGKEYVEILRDMVFRNLPEETKVKFTVFTDDLEDYPDIKKRPLPNPELKGWWNKLSLFKQGLFPLEDTIVFFDLDTVITGPLDDIVKYDGNFAILRDAYRPNGLQSSVMIWKGDHSHVWDSFEYAGCPDVQGGDQTWIEHVVPKFDILQEKFPKRFCSYKVSATNNIPEHASVVFFHGNPRPHEAEGWVKDFWKIGGATSLSFKNEGNTNVEQLIKNIDYSRSLGRKELSFVDSHDGHAVIVGGGPSLKGFAHEIKTRQEYGQKIFSVNNSWVWLRENGIEPDYHVLLDARPENAEFVIDVEQYYSSQCDKSVWDKSPNAILWNHENAKNLIDGGLTLNGGVTVGLNAISLSYVLGYREMHVYGFDSSYENGKHHAYEQHLNDNEKVLKVTFKEREFLTAPWMAEQAKQFCQLSGQLLSMGCTITIHGDGLLPYMARNTDLRTAADLRSQAILDRLDVENPIGAEVGVYTGELSRRLLFREDLTLHMVDSWVEHDKDSDYAATDFHGGLSKSEQDGFFQHTKNITNFAGKRAIIHRMDSLEASNKFEDGYFDFVFLDADHTYKGIKNDIIAWLPKVKDGGLICGHDYDNPDFPAWGVKQAVGELCVENGFQLDLGENFTWFCKKKA